MASLVRDLRFGFRTLAKAPGFTAVVVLTLALGIGANTAIFSIVHGVLLKPLAFEAPERLLSLWEYSPDDAGRMRKTRATAANFFDWKAHNTAFEDMALFGSAGYNWTGDGEPEQLLGARVTASYFSVLGVEPLLGRGFLEEDDADVVILGYGLWQRRFGASQTVIGETLTLDGAPFEVIGVARPGVYPTWPQASARMQFLPVYQEIFVPMVLNEERRGNRNSHVYGVLARLNDDATIESARAEMDTIAKRLEQAYPKTNAGERVFMTPYLDELVGGARPALFVLLGAVGLVLLITCANMAGLLIARSTARRQEVAVRSALGASRLALIRQFLSESLLLAMTGGLLGLGLAVVGVEVLIGLSPQQVPRLAQSGLELPVLAFAFVATLVTGLLFGLAPALQLSKLELADGTRTTSRQRLGRGLVIAEMTLAVVLLVGAGLLLQTFWRLGKVDLGFRSTNVLVAELALPVSSYSEPSKIARFFDELMARVESLPPVESVSIAYDHPLDSNWGDSFRIPGRGETEETLGATFRIVGEDYFRTMGIDVLRGRAFEELDDRDHPGAVIINVAFARRYFPDEDALGRSIITSTPRNTWGEPTPDSFEIVGIVKNIKFLGPDAADEPAFYVPARQFPLTDMVLVVRTSGDPASLAPRLRDTVWALDANLPIGNVTTMTRALDEALAQPRFNMLLLSVFGAAALALAAMGIYGLLAYDVTRRTSEIGIRMALGARSRDVVTLVVSQGVRLTMVGLALGLAAALLLTRVLSGLLFGVSTSDPATFAAVAVFLGAVALAASYIPARRATRIAPVTALRHE
ncbi:MAG: ABC transporter permease [Acidobacteriota bacterium]|nr:MAG: ABC transporter permease [Acidobacteriota bacterium]